LKEETLGTLRDADSAKQIKSIKLEPRIGKHPTLILRP
jgi:hypothetical protein